MENKKEMTKLPLWVLIRGTFVKSNKNHICVYTTTKPARLIGIPVSKWRNTAMKVTLLGKSCQPVS